MGTGVLRVPGPHGSSPSARQDQPWRRPNPSQAMVSSGCHRDVEGMLLPRVRCHHWEIPTGRGDRTAPPGSPRPAGACWRGSRGSSLGSCWPLPCRPTAPSDGRPPAHRSAIRSSCGCPPAAGEGRGGQGTALPALLQGHANPQARLRAAATPSRRKATIKPAEKNPMRSQRRRLSSWRRCREDPRERRRAERTCERAT